MNKKKLMRLIAVCTACFSMGVFAFSGCAKKGDGDSSLGGNTEIGGTTGGNTGNENQGGSTEGGNTGDNTQGGNTGNEGGNTGDTGNTGNTGNEGGNQGGTTEGGNTGDTGNEGGGTGVDPSTPGDPIVTPPKPEITGPVAGGPTITAYSEAELEAAYIEWTAADNAKWYNVYTSPKGANNWTKLDGPLVREYKDHFRADAVGLKAGEYDMKVVPVSGEDEEATEFAQTAKGITVVAHDRSGYAFVGGTASGAYNEDGTLREGAVVIYVTNENWQKVSVTYNGTTVTGIDNILGEGYQAKRGATKPLCVRIIGSIGNGSKIGFKANGDLELKALDQGVTVEGIGNDATANGWGMHIAKCSNVEIRNLAFMDMQGGTKDGVGFESGCHHVWTHNCDFFYGHNWGGDQKKGDGSLDTKDTTYVTHSYNHFWDSGKCNLQGMETSGDYKVTYHHNWYDHSDSRHPRIRVATAHIYNNYFDGNAKYGVGATNGSSVFVENNYFRSTSQLKPMMISMQGTDTASGTDEKNKTFSGENGGIIKSFGNKYDYAEGKLKLIERTSSSPADMVHFDCYAAAARDEKVPDSVKTLKGGTGYNNFDTASDMYTYKVDSPEVAKEKVERYAGRLDGGDLKFDFDDSKEDGNYDIIPELSAKITGYSKTITLVKIGGETVSSGSSGGNTGGNEGGNTGTEGGNEGGETPVNPPATIDGKIVYDPNVGANGTYGIFTVTGGYKSGSTAVEVEGITVAAGKAVKFNSGGSVSFTVDKRVTLTVYINKNGIKINDGSKITGTQNGAYYVITTTLEAGTYTVKQGDGESQLYLLTLIPA